MRALAFLEHDRTDVRAAEAEMRLTLFATTGGIGRKDRKAKQQRSDDGTGEAQ